MAGQGPGRQGLTIVSGFSVSAPPPANATCATSQRSGAAPRASAGANEARFGYPFPTQMTAASTYLAVVLLLALVSFYTQRLRPDVTALLVMLSLLVPWQPTPDRC